MPRRTVDFGLLGPNATSFTYRAGGRDRTARPLGGVGAFLVVQKRIEPVMREYGFHHKDPKLNLIGPAEPSLSLTPGSQVIKRVEYAGGVCVVRVTMAARGACNAQAGYVPIPQPKVADVRAPLRVFLTPDKQAFRVRFRAREAVVDGRSAYTIEVRPIGAHGFITHSYSRNVAAGGLVHTTVGLYNHRRGSYRIVVRYRAVQLTSRPVRQPGVSRPARRPGPHQRALTCRVLMTSAGVAPPRRAVATAYCMFARPAGECASVEQTSAIPASIASRTCSARRSRRIGSPLTSSATSCSSATSKTRSRSSAFSGRRLM